MKAPVGRVVYKDILIISKYIVSAACCYFVSLLVFIRSVLGE